MIDLLPIFPLPTTVLFPSVFLPLHIFEPRYREMVADALESDRMLGMVLLKPGWQRDYEQRPAIYPIGCSGVITHVERLPDGRYNIVLRGVERFRIVEEDHGKPYRRALTEPMPEHALSGDESRALRAGRAKLEALITPAVEHSRMLQHRTGIGTSTMTDEDLINALAQYLDIEPLEKQALLERDCLRSRAEALLELLEMKMLVARTPGLSNVSH